MDERVSTPSHIKDLIADPANRRKHNPRNIGMVVDALHKIGAARSIVIDENNEVLAGNGVVEAAGQAGITRVQVVEADGNTIIAVRRRGLTDSEKRDLAIYDNRAGELAEWETEQLQRDLDAGEDLSAFFRDDEIDKLLDRKTPDPEEPAAPADRYAEQYGVIVICHDESEQKQTFETLTQQGLSCRVVTT